MLGGTRVRRDFVGQGVERGSVSFIGEIKIRARQQEQGAGQMRRATHMGFYIENRHRRIVRLDGGE
ncbi:hypothetical protein CQW49_08425 [Methylosinus trichosporium OB3b]|uniref:Uncharacterized protein n=1 Tax=Methylosinus trichosporium (strain ATCC 35070 / NCIMB 11131 / UNIQEM 75 / OB3b) TaxID=595536 RepID=A0A2D2CYU2_METT3|nr:hypothetical protein CQW49_08425 [Methylosinus trichosporium OB3b]OBS54018.1 hypothetical protein A8B73_02890 [Methylosinus sp. 3S-1]